jgi:hypothetical protein
MSASSNRLPIRFLTTIPPFLERWMLHLQDFFADASLAAIS